MLKLQWSERAQRDLLDIATYIARNNRAAAKRWLSALRTRALKICDAPKAGRIVPEFQQESIREIVIGSYRLIYRVEPKTVTILTVFEGHRLFPQKYNQSND